MSVVSNDHLCMYTFVLVIFCSIFLATAFNNESNIKNKVSFYPNNADHELKNIENCKNLCKQCDCLGFYCGEECICECNNDHSDTECIRTIQLSAQNLNIPFEVLIQGPRVNKFVRNALQFEQNQERKLHAYRYKRSTVTVYKPNKVLPTKQETSSIEEKSKAKVKNRSKRSSSNFEWFSDFRNNLLRPAPLRGYKRKTIESVTQPPAVPSSSTTVSSLIDNSWLFDNTGYIVTPKPLNSPKMSSELDSSIDALNMQNLQPPGNKFNDDSQININYGENNNEHHFLPEQNDQLEYMDDLAGDPYAQSFKHDLSHIENDKYLFSEDDEKTKSKETEDSKTDNLTLKLLKDLLTASKVSSTTKKAEGLPPFRIPWFKPATFLEKLRKVIES